MSGGGNCGGGRLYTQHISMKQARFKEFVKVLPSCQHFQAHATSDTMLSSNDRCSTLAAEFLGVEKREVGAAEVDCCTHDTSAQCSPGT